MAHRRLAILLVTIVLLFSEALWPINGQGRSQRAPKPAIPPVPAPKEDKWWAAQRSIEAAIQQLEIYLREHPNGTRAATARQQIDVLRDLTITASRPEWATMDHMLHMLDTPDWRVSSISRLADRTRVTIEIWCKRRDGEDCRFVAFSNHPLVLVDNAGKFYPMLEATPLASDTRFTDTGKVLLSGGRVLSLSVDFAPLAPQAASGQLQYRDSNTADPARFSVLRKK